MPVPQHARPGYYNGGAVNTVYITAVKITHNLQDRKIHSREDRNQVTRLRNTKTEVKKIEARERSYYSHYKGVKIDTS